MSNAARKIAVGDTEIVSRDPVDSLVNLAKALGDRLRADILRVLHQDSYAVGELCQVFNVPQPALSHHLKILLTAGLVARRREGNSLFYRRATPSPAAGAFLAELDQEPIERRQAERIARIHASRNDRSARFFEENATEIRAHQAEICEPATYQDVVLELVDEVTRTGLERRQALEVGPGANNLLSALADRFEKAIGVDNSRSMLATAAAALPADSPAELRHQDFMALPRRRRYDVLVAAMVIHHQASPAAFFKQSAALLKPGGSLVVAELCQHDQEWAQSACGDQWLGFEPDQLVSWAARAGLIQANAHYLAQKNGFRVQVHRFTSPE
jgi:ArsR family transcriptional regulator